jgi:hypothetical protein
MAYLMLYGNGWTQRWRIAPGMEDNVRSQISQVGTAGTGQLPVVDPASESEVTLVVAWAHVATAAVLEAPGPSPDDSAGQYA